MSGREGRVVDATVTRVEEYGLYLAADDGIEIVVLIPDVASSPTNLKEAWRVGDRTPVEILRYVETDGIYKGSIVRAAR